MISPSVRVLTLSLAATFVVAASGRTQTPGGVIHTVEIPAPSLRGNLLGDADKRAVSIYLPADYARHPARRYPVIYLLHGFAADNRAFIAGVYSNLNIRVSMDSLIAAGKVRPMIVVTPNARNRFDGSFYVNSPTTGNWEDFVVHDLVRYIDRHFRTIATRSGRGLAGHSMGGYGTLYIGMRNPTVFSAIYALSPCCLDTNAHETPAVRRAWRKVLAVRDTSEIRTVGFIPNIIMALAAVYSPDPARPPFFVDYPVSLAGDSVVVDSAIAARWKPPLKLVDQYQANLRREKIGFDAGRQDAFPDIPVNVQALDAKLTALGIPHIAELYDGDHVRGVRGRLENVVLPFFSQNLAGGKASRRPGRE
ncbi:MAG: alpha/beta hydrolase [Gemmatimonadaceae bacterium]